MNHRMWVATRKGLFTLARSAGRWDIVGSAFLGDPVSMVLHDPRDNSVYAAVGHSHFGAKLHRSADGVDWNEWITPAYPQPPEGTRDVCPSRGIEIPWRVELIWSLETAGRDQPGVLWCGTLPGGLFRFDPSASHWQLVRSLWDQPARRKWFGGGYDYPGIHSICVNPTDTDHITVGVSCGGVWVTRDGGGTWSCKADGMFADYMPPQSARDPEIQDPHRLVQCPNAPDHIWAQHHNGVFRSTDASDSWQAIHTVKPSTFGFAAAVHPHDPRTCWLVPALADERRVPVDGQVVVARTRDGGESFQVLRPGLPSQHAYDIVYRHALDVDHTGDTLAMGSTTGSLWVSRDQGDNWRTVTNHLPPIYCVRFDKPLA